MPQKTAAKKTAAKKAAAKKAAAKKAAAKKAVQTAEAPDPRFTPVARAFAKTAGVSLMESKSGGTRGLMLNGKSFGMSLHGRLMLKLTEERVADLIADGVGKPFEPSAGRILKNWIEVTHPEADWVALAKEAYRIGTTERGTKKTSPKRRATG